MNGGAAAQSIVQQIDNARVLHFCYRYKAKPKPYIEHLDELTHNFSFFFFFFRCIRAK